MGDQKGFSMVLLFAVVTLLNCCQASNFFLPRVSRTDDAIVIDFDGSGYAAPFQSKSWFGQIANPGFIPVPSFNPYPMMFRQQQRPSGWPYPSVHPSSLTPAGVPFYKQFDGEDEEEEPIYVKQAAATCGTGPNTMPTARGSISERVVGGTDAKRGAWPFMVILKLNPGDSLLCTGTLVSDTRVLLAAQCLEDLSTNELSQVIVLIGLYAGDLSDVQMTRRISKVVLHGKYNSATFANDIAIVVLDSPVILSRTVAPACLPPASTDPDQYVDNDAMILGWGQDSPFPNAKLQQAKVAVWSNSDCKLDPTIGKYVTDNSTCVTSDKNNKFTCLDNDVGGPVVILPSPGAWTVIGINSYTKDCTSNGLKTRVSAYRAWIDLYMK